MNIPRKRRFPRQPLSYTARLAVIFGVPLDLLAGGGGTIYPELQASDFEYWSDDMTRALNEQMAKRFGGMT